MSLKTWPVSGRRRARRSWWAVTASALVIVLLAFGGFATGASAARPTPRLDRIVYSSDRGEGFDLWAADVDGGNEVRLTTHPADDMQADVSPDGRQIVFVRGVVRGSTPSTGHLWLMNADGSDARRLVDHRAEKGNGEAVIEFRPEFSPDGTKIVYSRYEGAITAPHELWTANADGSQPRRMVTGANFGSWSPDGTKVVHNILPDLQLRISRLDGTEVRTLTASPGNNVAPKWSPDGTRIVFTSYRNGDGEAWVMNADGTDQHVVASSPGKDGLAAWSPDGSRIAFGSSRHTPCPPSLTELCPHQLFTMKADGSDLTLVADNAVSDMWPAYFPRSRRPADIANRSGSSA